MALYWPEQRIALDIVDDPQRRPFEGDDSYTVLRVTCADLVDYDSFCKINAKLCELLGCEAPQVPAWEERAQDLHESLVQMFAGMQEAERPCSFADDEPDVSSYEIIATSEQEAVRMRAAARARGKSVRGVSVWEGPVPPGSFEELPGGLRMSTPEYFFLRKANELPFVQAVSLGLELCGKFRSSVTQYNRSEGYDFLRCPRTSKARLRSYLRGTRGTIEGKRAKHVLRLVADECTTPMSSYLYLMLCAGRSDGCYGLERGLPSSAFVTDDGFMPDASGKYLAYDLSWADKHVAVQYTGARRPGERHLAALRTHGMRVVCVTDADLVDDEHFERIAREVADLLGTPLPRATDSWRAKHRRVRELVPPPAFDHMRNTMADISAHAIV